MTHHRRLPPAARAFLGIVVAAGAGVLGWRAIGLPAWSARDVVASLVVAVAGWLGAGLAMAAYFAVNEVCLARIISLVEGSSFLGVLTMALALSVMQFAGNLAIGVMGAALWRLSPRLLPLLAAPVSLAFLG